MSDERVVKIDWTLLLAFDQVEPERTFTPVGDKVGAKVGPKIGAKRGDKPGWEGYAGTVRDT